MIRSSSERIKNSIRESFNFKKEIEDKVKTILENDEQFFEALLLYGKGMRKTFHPEQKNEDKNTDLMDLSYVEMIYAILATLEKGGFIEITRKTDRLANNVFDEYIKHL